MARVSAKTQNFSSRDRQLSFICIVILPYLKTKIESKIKEYNDREPPHHIKRLSTCLTTSQTIWDFAKLILYIRYLAHKTESYTPMLKLCKLSLQYPAETFDTELNWMDVIKGRVGLAHVMSNMLFKGLELSAYFLQFIQWWQSQSHKASSIGSLPIPPAPDVWYEGKKLSV